MKKARRPRCDTWPYKPLLREKLLGVTNAEGEREGLSPTFRPDSRPVRVSGVFAMTEAKPQANQSNRVPFAWLAVNEGYFSLLALGLIAILKDSSVPDPYAALAAIVFWAASQIPLMKWPAPDFFSKIHHRE